MSPRPYTPETPGSGPQELSIQGITKGYLGVQALKGVELNVRRGSIHALAGQNGAGKSTLVKILSGAEEPDSGTIVLGGQERRFRSPQDAQDAGIQTIYQELSLVPELSVAENIFLGSLPVKSFSRIVGLVNNDRPVPRGACAHWLRSRRAQVGWAVFCGGAASGGTR